MVRFVIAGNALLVKVSFHDTLRFSIVEIDVLVLENDIDPSADINEVL
jgi:hypothetical protein